VEAFGGLDVVVANAGVGAFGFTRSMDPAAFDRIIEVNVLGVHRTIRAALPHVVERRGYVIPIASFAALGHLGGMAPYAASKAAVEAFADSLREELRPHGVAVGCAYFSWIDTEMVHGTDATRVGAILRGGMRGPAAKTYTVADAAEALVAGIERRARWVTVPRWLRAALLLRGLIQPVMDLDPRLRKAVVEADRAALEEVARIGSDATAMVGAGGEADRRARASRVR
jgi:NAD(P)-dependent dehydrogenase (short-subunit alcohol dehydrogenase family)